MTTTNPKTTNMTTVYPTNRASSFNEWIAHVRAEANSSYRKNNFSEPLIDRTKIRNAFWQQYHNQNK